MEADVRRSGLILLAALGGCEVSPQPLASDSGDTGRDTADTADTADTGAPTTTTASDATQVGSEGFWGCPVETVTPILDPTELEPSLGVAPADLVIPRLGAWILAITELSTTGAAPGGTLALSAGEQWRLVDVTDGPGCVDHVAVAVTGALVRGPGAPLTVGGVLAARPDGLGALVLTAPAQAATDWGTPPSSTGVTWFRVDASITADQLDGGASFAGCPATEPSCASALAVATLAGAR